MKNDYPVGMVEEWHRFFVDEPRRKPGELVYPELLASDTIFPLQRRYELAEMMRLAQAINPVTVYEIGADKGGGLYHWVKCLPTVRNVIACEIRGLPYRSEFEQAFPDVRFLWLEESSYDAQAITKVREFLGQTKIDCLFIDGDKCAFDIDFYAYLPYMNPNGVVFMHDIKDESPRAGFDKVMRDGYPARTFTDTRDTMTALALEKEGIPPAGPHEGWLRYWKGTSCGVGVLGVCKIGSTT